MPITSSTEYVKQLASMWQERAPGSGLSPHDYLRELARLASSLKPPVAAAEEEEGLELFRQRVMVRANDLRWRMLGANVQRRSLLTSVQRGAVHSLELEPDLLGPMGESRYEPIHTKLLAYHLNPLNGSELAPLLLKALLAVVAERCQERGLAQPSYLPGSKASVEAERVTSKGRVDISISLPDTLILIENKVDAEEGPAQLARYHDALGELRGNRQGLLVYLTLPGAAQPKSSIPYAHLTFRDVLQAWLPVATHGGGAAEYLARYLKSIACGVLRLCRRGGFDQWSFREQRAILDLVEECVA